MKRRLAYALLALAVLAVAFVQVFIEHPRVHVRWRDTVDEAVRVALEDRYSLEAGELVEGTTWRYEVRNRSRDNIGALLSEPAVADTAYVDRERQEVPEPRVVVGFGRARTLAGPAPRGVLQPQSGLLIVAGVLLLWAGGRADERGRRRLTMAVVSLTAVAAFALPLRQPIRMGDSTTYVETRQQFEEYTGVRQIRFESHLAHALLGQIDKALGRASDSPARAFDALMRAATIWFLSMAAAVAMLERWSPEAVRYVALVLMGPVTLLYFGYREIGHLSLNALTFPLLLQGLRDGGRRVEASAALAGFGAALHGFGLLSVAGSLLAAATRPGEAAASERLALVLRIAAWSAAAYLGWVALYQIVLTLPITPGHADAIPWRPWLSDVVTDRVNAAIFSLRGARDIGATAVLVGMPLLAIAASLRRRFPVEVTAALVYAVPSVIFVVLFWPIQGLAVEIDLLFAVAWACAQDRRASVAAAVALAVAHVMFWRVALDSAFVNSRVS